MRPMIIFRLMMMPPADASMWNIFSRHFLADVSIAEAVFSSSIARLCNIYASRWGLMKYFDEDADYASRWWCCWPQHWRDDVADDKYRLIDFFLWLMRRDFRCTPWPMWDSRCSWCWCRYADFWLSMPAVDWLPLHLPPYVISSAEDYRLM